VLSFFHILRVIVACFNPLDCRGNYSATSNNMKLVHWPLMGGLLHLAQRGGNWAGPQPAEAHSRCIKCNSPPINGQCTNHRKLLYNGPLFSGFNVPIKDLPKKTRTAGCSFCPPAKSIKVAKGHRPTLNCNQIQVH